MKTIAELTAGGGNVDSVVDDFLGVGTRPEETTPDANSDEVEHVASAADDQPDFADTAPGYPEYLEKFADNCDNLAQQLAEIPKEAAITGDPRIELGSSPVTEIPQELRDASALVDRVLGSGGAS